MTVHFSRFDPSLPHRGFDTRRDDPEPTLDELLDDPTLQTLMARDSVERGALKQLVRSIQDRLGLQPFGSRAAAVFEAALFAECRTS